MDDPTRTIGFELGDTFAEALTQTTQALVCVLDRDGTLHALQRCVRARDGLHAPGGARPACIESVIPPEEAEAFREVLAFIWTDGPLEPTGRALADEGRRPAPDRVVEQAGGG